MTIGGLSTSDINHMLRGVKIFKGAFSSDSVILRSKSQTQAFVINTDRQTSPGSHWVGLIVSNGKCCFFDSFGCENLNLDILNTLKDVGIKRYNFNSKQIQSVYSDKCGFYCVAFILSFCYGISYRKFIDIFSDDLAKNDEICLQFLNEIYF